MAKKYMNDPLDFDWSDDMIRRMKWNNPKSEMSYDDIEREGDGDFVLGGMRITARFLGLPEPYVIDDGAEEDPAALAAFHKALLTSFAGDVPGFTVDERDSLMLTALRLRDLHPEWWRVYVEKFDLDDETLRRVYGVENRR